MPFYWGVLRPASRGGSVIGEAIFLARGLLLTRLLARAPLLPTALAAARPVVAMFKLTLAMSLLLPPLVVVIGDVAEPELVVRCMNGDEWSLELRCVSLLLRSDLGAPWLWFSLIIWVHSAFDVSVMLLELEDETEVLLGVGLEVPFRFVKLAVLVLVTGFWY